MLLTLRHRWKLGAAIAAALAALVVGAELLRPRTFLAGVPVRISDVPEAGLSGRTFVPGADGQVRAEGRRAESARAEAEAKAREAEAVARAAVAEARGRAAREVEQTRTTLQGRLLLDGRAETERLAYEQAVLAADRAAGELARRAEEVRARQDAALARMKAIEVLEHRLRESLPAGPDDDSVTSAVLERLRQERDGVRSEIALQRLDRAPESPAYQERVTRLQDLQEEIRKELYRAREETLLSLRNLVDRLDTELRSIDERALRKRLEREELLRGLARLDPRLASIDEARKAVANAEKAAHALAGVVLLETAGPAVVLDSSGGPRGRVLAAGLGGGLAAGLLAMGLLAAFDRRVRSDADVKRRLGLPTLALVPTADGDPLLMRRGAVDPQATAYSLGAAVLRSYLEERQFQTVYVTSAEAGEGKSTAAANLATALARRGVTVALVDADLRSPTLGATFGIDESYGLGQILLGGELMPELPAGETPLTALRVLPAGMTEELPPEILAADRMGEILRGLGERHEVVILDGPPLQAGGDAVTLARLADTVVWVVRSGRAAGGRLGWTRHVLRNIRADVAGVVLVGAAEGAPERTYGFSATAPR